MSRFHLAVPPMLARGLCAALVAELSALNSGSSTCTVLTARKPDPSGLEHRAPRVSEPNFELLELPKSRVIASASRPTRVAWKSFLESEAKKQGQRPIFCNWSIGQVATAGHTGATPGTV
jgi:hypothetical protein